MIRYFESGGRCRAVGAQRGLTILGCVGEAYRYVVSVVHCAVERERVPGSRALGSGRGCCVEEDKNGEGDEGRGGSEMHCWGSEGFSQPENRFFVTVDDSQLLGLGKGNSHLRFERVGRTALHLILSFQYLPLMNKDIVADTASVPKACAAVLETST